MSVTARLRYEVLRRDGFACRYCGRKAPDVQLEVDHVLPLALGGSDEAGNLVAACVACNAGKSSSSPDAPIVDAVADDALRWAMAMRAAAEMQARQQEERDDYVAAFDAEWTAWGYGTDRDQFPRPLGWSDSIERFHDLGLPIGQLIKYVEKAMARPRSGKHGEFTYLCGICWRVLDEQRKIAEGLIATEGEG